MSKKQVDVDAYDVVFDEQGPLGLDLESSNDGNDAYVVKSTNKKEILVSFYSTLMIW